MSIIYIMIGIIKILFSVCLASSYKLLPYEFGEPILKYRLCEGINSNLRETMIQTMTNYNQLGFNTLMLTSDTDPDVIPVCNETMSIDRYGYATFIDKIEYIQRSIKISNYILEIPKTLWNVVYHEILHTVGLGHSKEPGLMYYTVTLTRNYEVIPDDEIMYPSEDDIAGLELLYPETGNTDVIEVRKNNRHIMKKLSKLCSLLN